MQSKINEIGRSMVEMLGVLAVIGILSVGGVMGYKFAMLKYAANADHTGCVCSGDAARWNQYYNYCCPAGTTAYGDFCRKPDGTCVDEYGNTVSWC